MKGPAAHFDVLVRVSSHLDVSSVHRIALVAKGFQFILGDAFWRARGRGSREACVVAHVQAHLALVALREGYPSTACYMIDCQPRRLMGLWMRGLTGKEWRRLVRAHRARRLRRVGWMYWHWVRRRPLALG